MERSWKLWSYYCTLSFVQKRRAWHYSRTVIQQVVSTSLYPPLQNTPPRIVLLFSKIYRYHNTWYSQDFRNTEANFLSRTPTEQTFEHLGLIILFNYLDILLAHFISLKYQIKAMSKSSLNYKVYNSRGWSFYFD